MISWISILLFITSVRGHEVFPPPAPQILSFVITKSQSLEIKWSPIYQMDILGYRVRLYEVAPTVLNMKVENADGKVLFSEQKEVPASLTNKTNMKKKRAVIDVIGYSNSKVRIDDILDDVLYEFTVTAFTEHNEGRSSTPKRFRIKGRNAKSKTFQKLAKLGIRN